MFCIILGGLTNDLREVGQCLNPDDDVAHGLIYICGGTTDFLYKEALGCFHRADVQ